jgi:hypothetical protein
MIVSSVAKDSIDFWSDIDTAYLDPSYPDNTYNGTRMCGTYRATNVISVSYGGQEVDLPAYYQQRQCNECVEYPTLISGPHITVESN